MPILDAPPSLHPSYMRIAELPGECFVVAAVGNREKQLATRLREMNVAYYLPMWLKRVRRNSHSFVDVPHPYLPGYLFVFGDDITRADVRLSPRTRGLLYDVQAVKQQAPLIEALEGMRLALSTDTAPPAEWTPRVGERVGVKRGPWVGKFGTVAARPDARRYARVIMELLGQRIEIEVDADHLEQAA